MTKSAKVTSIEALREFAVALREFDHQAREALTQLQLESRRALDWVENDRMRYWPNQARRASDAVNEARINLQRCEMAIRAEDRRPCTEERKALEKAKQRQRFTEEKVQVTRQWNIKLKHEVDEFSAHIAKLTHLLESETPRSLAHLERMAAALDKYAARTDTPT